MQLLISATASPAYRLTVSDRRDERLSASPTLSAEYEFATSDSAELLAQLLLQQQIHAPGRWQMAIAGGIRELTIAEIGPSHA